MLDCLCVHIMWLGGNSATRSVGRTSATQTPCELHSILRIKHSVLRINPYNWTFPNCNISFIMDQSSKKTTNESDCYKQHIGKPVLLWEPCYLLGNKTIVWVVWKVRTDILLADLVCFEVHCLKRLLILVLHINRKLMNWYVSYIFSKEHLHKVKSKFSRWTNFLQHKLCLGELHPHHMREICPFCLLLFLGLMYC